MMIVAEDGGGSEAAQMIKIRSIHSLPKTNR